MKILKAKILIDDLIFQYLPANYSEAFACTYKSTETISTDDLQISFWTNSPKWINALFKLRNWIVKPLGLKSPDDTDKNEKLINCIRTGISNGIMGVPAKADDETVISLNDKHLKMYFSIRLDKIDDTAKAIKVSTIVHFHNKLGRTYFYIIFPFHHLIIHSKIKQMIKEIKNKENGEATKHQH